MSRLLYLRRTGAAFFLGCWGAAPKKFVKSSDTSGIWFCTLIFAFNENNDKGDDGNNDDDNAIDS